MTRSDERGQTPSVVRAFVAAVAIGLLLASCGDDGGTDPTEGSTTESDASDESPSSETTVGEPAGEGAAVDVCAAIDAALVETLLGAGATAGMPVEIEVPADGCVWESEDGADVLAAATVSAIPGAGETEDAFSMFGLSTDDYDQTSRSSGTGGESSEGEPGATVVVITGVAESVDETDAENDALNEIFDLLDNVDADG